MLEEPFSACVTAPTRTAPAWRRPFHYDSSYSLLPAHAVVSHRHLKSSDFTYRLQVQHSPHLIVPLPSVPTHTWSQRMTPVSESLSFLHVCFAATDHNSATGSVLCHMDLTSTHDLQHTLNVKMLLCQCLLIACRAWMCLKLTNLLNQLKCLLRQDNSFQPNVFLLHTLPWLLYLPRASVLKWFLNITGHLLCYSTLKDRKSF